MTAYAYTGNANLVNYSKETLLAFNARQSVLRETTHREYFPDGLQAVFLVGDDGKGYAKGRSPGGDLSPAPISTAQYTAQFEALFAKAEKDNEQIDFSQANWIKLMIDSVVSKMHRTNDYKILVELDNATHAISSTINDVTPAIIANLRAYLTRKYVPNDQNMTLACGPSLFSSLSQNTTFSNSLYTAHATKQVDMNEPGWKDQPITFMWQGINIIQIPFVPFNTSTSVETNYLYHKNAIGSAVEMVGDNAVQTYADVPNQKQGVVAPFKVANKILQNDGIIKIPFKSINDLTIS